MKEVQCHILFVEDNLDTQEIVSMFLQIEGYQVTSAHTAAEALRLASTQAFNLYLLDNRLPDESGITLCRQLRERDPYTPILFYSAKAYETDKQQALAAGAQGYLVKDDPGGILDGIQRMLNGEVYVSKEAGAV